MLGARNDWPLVTDHWPLESRSRERRRYVAGSGGTPCIDRAPLKWQILSLISMQSASAWPLRKKSGAGRMVRGPNRKLLTTALLSLSVMDCSVLASLGQ